MARIQEEDECASMGISDTGSVIIVITQSKRESRERDSRTSLEFPRGENEGEKIRI